tara:strand:+ start:301 stop:780 length:480 start_codon:yes stop_codon:yes gene_type:complete
MIEVVAAVSAASSAFNAIKKGFEVGRDIESMAGDMGRWMGAVSDIKKAEEYNKKPPLFKKLFAAGSVEEEAMQIFMAKKKADDMREQLRQIITFTRGPSAWQELLKTEADIRKKRQAMIYAQKERQAFFIEVGVGIVLGGLIIAGVVWFGMWAYEYKYG